MNWVIMPAFELLRLRSYDRALEDFIQLLIILADFAGALVIAVAVARALVTFVVTQIRTGKGGTPSEPIRLTLGRSLALALEFLLGADILKTILDPSRDDLIILGAIAALRTLLNYFLDRELAEEQRRNREAAGTRGSGTRQESSGRHASV